MVFCNRLYDNLFEIASALTYRQRYLLNTYALMPQFYVTLPSKKMGIFEVGFLTISHLLTCIVSMILRVVIYNYLTKKPPGTVFENHHKKSSFISLGLKIQMRHFD